MQWRVERALDAIGTPNEAKGQAAALDLGPARRRIAAADGDPWSSVLEVNDPDRDLASYLMEVAVVTEARADDVELIAVASAAAWLPPLLTR